jgi:Ser/Thr protein kinase RdoA (MazF antagonist)
MEDRTAYAFNSLLERHYAIGRVIRFRHLQRGRQATCFEVLTAGQREYLLQLFPPEYQLPWLQRAMRVLEAASRQGFPAPRPEASTPTTPSSPCLVVDGPQGSHLVLTEIVGGQYLPRERWTPVDLSHLGLRLAWLHRILAEMPAIPTKPPSLVEQVRHWSRATLPHHRQDFPAPSPAHVDLLLQMLADRHHIDAVGLAHGGISPEAILLDADRQIVNVVDWGLCQAGHSAQDVVDAFVYWCIRPDGMVARDEAQALLEAYGSLASQPVASWQNVVLGWCGRHLIDHYTGCRPLPRGFGTILANPDSLTAAISFCQSK